MGMNYAYGALAYCTKSYELSPFSCLSKLSWVLKKRILGIFWVRGLDVTEILQKR